MSSIRDRIEHVITALGIGETAKALHTSINTMQKVREGQKVLEGTDALYEKYLPAAEAKAIEAVKAKQEAAAATLAALEAGAGGVKESAA